MTLSPMEPNVSNNSCHGLESIRVCKLQEMLKHSARESLFFQVAGQASGKSVVGNIQGLFCEADQWSVGNCTQPSHAKYSAEVVKEVNGQKSLWKTRKIMRAIDSKQYSTEVFKEVNGQKSLWRTREVTRVIDHDQLMCGFIS